MGRDNLSTPSKINSIPKMCGDTSAKPKKKCETTKKKKEAQQKHSRLKTDTHIRKARAKPKTP